MMQTRFTTLQTPWDTGVTRESVLNANWLYLHQTEHGVKTCNSQNGTFTSSASMCTERYSYR